MKLRLTSLIIIFLSSLVSFGQNSKNDSLKYCKDAAIYEMDKSPGNEKAIFGDYITAVGNLLSTNSGALNVQFTPYAISRKPWDSLDYNYLKSDFGHMLLRNTQINFGVIPDKIKNYKIDTLTPGITYSILNNKKANNKSWKSTFGAFESISHKMTSALNSLLLGFSTDSQNYYQLNNFMHEGDSTQITSSDLRKMILDATGAKSLKEIYLPFNKVYQDFLNRVTKQWLWTVSINGKYNIARIFFSGYTVSSTISKAIYADTLKRRQFSLQLIPSYNAIVDTI